MYQFDLAESLIPAQEDDTVVETTVGDLLRKVARQHSQAPALVEVESDGQTNRRWTYAELLTDS